MAKTEKYRYHIFQNSRGICFKCENKSDCVLVRMFAPQKMELRICHDCLIEYLILLTWLKKPQDRLNEFVGLMFAKDKKEEGKINVRNEQFVSPSVADLESETATIAEGNGQN